MSVYSGVYSDVFADVFGPTVGGSSMGYAEIELPAPDADLTDFSLLIDLSNLPVEWWAEVDTADGTKGRAFKDDGTTELACDWIDFDNVGETGYVRVKWSGTLASAGGDIVRIYPPLSANASYAVGDTYGQYAAYQDWDLYVPLQSDFVDRTSGKTPDFVSGGLVAGDSAGQFGNAVDLDGTSESIQYASSIGTAAYTMLTWIRCEEASNYQYNVVVEGGNGSNPYTTLVWNADPAQRCIAATPTTGGPDQNGSYTGTAPNNTWHHLAGKYTLTSRRAVLNGIAAGANTSTPGQYTITRINLGAKFVGGVDYEFDGQLQDFQAHAADRSVEWIKYEYTQSVDNATFLTNTTWNAGEGGGEGEGGSAARSITRPIARSIAR